MAEHNTVIDNMMEQSRNEAGRERIRIKRRGDELRAEQMKIENTLLEKVDNCEIRRLGILQRKKEELEEQSGYAYRYSDNRPNEEIPGQGGEGRDVRIRIPPPPCHVNALPEVAVSDALHIKFKKAASYHFSPADYGTLSVGTRPLKRLTKYDLRYKIEVTRIMHHDIDVIEPASNSQCWFTHTDNIFLYSRDGTRQLHFPVTDRVIDMVTCQSGKTTFVALKNNNVLKIQRTGDSEYERPTRVFRTKCSIGSIAVDSSNQLFVFDATNAIFRTYDEYGNNMSEEKPLPAIMRKVRSVGYHAVFAARIQDNVVTIKTVNRTNDTTVTLARRGMEATQVCHCNLGFFAVFGYTNLKLHRFAEDGLFIDAYELGQRGLTSSDRQWFFRFSTFTVDGDGNIWVGDKHGNVKIYSPF